MQLVLIAGYGLAAGLVAVGAMAWHDDEPEAETPLGSGTPEVKRPARLTETEQPVATIGVGADPQLRMPRVQPLPFDRESVDNQEDQPDDVDLEEELAAIGTMQGVRAASRPSDLDEIARYERIQELIGAEIVPEYSGEEFVGLRVHGNPAQDGVLRAIGVAEGSLITSVNGYFAGDERVPPELLFEELSAQSQIEITLTNP